MKCNWGIYWCRFYCGFCRMWLREYIFSLESVNFERFNQENVWYVKRVWKEAYDLSLELFTYLQLPRLHRLKSTEFSEGKKILLSTVHKIPSQTTFVHIPITLQHPYKPINCKSTPHFTRTTHNPLFSNLEICITWRWSLWTETCFKRISHIRNKQPLFAIYGIFLYI
jgi:hypothetical protein